jgi:hypothetical protein
MTQRDPIKPPYIDFCDDTDWSDCSRFLHECVDALIDEITQAVADPRDAPRIVASMLEATAVQLKPKPGRPPGSRTKYRSNGPHVSESTKARRRREERQLAEEERARKNIFEFCIKASKHS